MVLIYLCTLGLPGLANKQPSPRRHSAVQHAYFLGNRYNLLHLRDHGRPTLKHSIHTNLSARYKKENVPRVSRIQSISRACRWTIAGSDQAREALPDALIGTPKANIEHEQFQP